MTSINLDRGTSLQSKIRRLQSYEGWWMVLVGMAMTVCVVVTPLTLFKLIYGPVIDEMEWSRTQATLVVTYKFAIGATAAFFFIGPLIERFGIRRIIISSAVLTGMAMIAFLNVQSLWFYYGLGMIFGLTGTGTMVSVKILVSRWFNRNQGLAVGLALSGMSIGAAIIPLIAEPLIRLFGWRETYAGMSIGIWVLAIPFYLWKANENPTVKDILPETVGDKDDPTLTKELEKAELDMNIKDVLRTPMFWLIAVSLYLASVVDSGILQHTILFLDRDVGLGSQIAAFGLSGTFALGIFAKIGAGWLYDRLSTRGIVICYILLAITVLLAFPVAGITTLIIFTVARALAHGGLISESPILAKHVYGANLMGRVLPILTGTYMLGAGTGPVILSMFYDHYGTYKQGFILFVFLPLIAAILMYFVRPIYRERLQEIRTRHTAKRAAVEQTGK